MEPKRRGRFIVLEGVDGTGKSTQMEAAVTFLRQQGLEVVQSREPGGTEVGEAIRGVLFGDYEQTMPVMSELLLFAAARVAHVKQVIRPALARGAWVVSDRFVTSSQVYQGMLGGLGKGTVEMLHNVSCDGLNADRVIVLDVDAQTAGARLGGRAGSNRLDSADDQAHNDRRECYRELALADPNRYQIVSAEPSVEQVSMHIRDILACLAIENGVMLDCA